MSRGLNWLQALAGGQALAGYQASVKVVDGTLGERAARYIAVVPDAENPFPRARNGEVGLLEGWALGQALDEVIAADRDKADKRVVVAVVDVPSQAYGRREEALGIHQALAGAVDGYARARLAGHPVIALLVGKAQDILYAALGKNAFVGVLSGAAITTLVQSSSTTTALTVPLAASGKFKVRTLFPFVVGANIGTTVTGLIAAFSASGAEAEAAMAGALVHTLFNTFAAILILGVPFLRKLPPAGSDWLAGLATKNKMYVFAWIGGVFFIIPILAVFISNALS